MGFKCGIIGLPNVGKSTLYNALTKKGAPAENYPFCTIDPNIGIVEVPDKNLPVLAEMVKPERVVPTTIQFVDIAGLVQGASRGEGLGNKFLGHIRETDAIVHVVRCFDDENVSHVDGNVDPVRDCEVIETELCLADLETVEKRMVHTEKMLKTGEKKYKEEMSILQRLKEGLNEGKKAREIITGDEKEYIKEISLLTMKPVLLVANIGEEDLEKRENQYTRTLKEYASKKGLRTITICAEIEEELARLDQDEKEEFLQDFGLEQSGLDLLIREGYKLLELITFYTTDGPEVRAWTVKRGTKAPQAAGKIHTDFERGFICAEVVPFEELVSAGSLAGAREKGIIRIEGKDYEVQDTDVIHFKFNV